MKLKAILLAGLLCLSGIIHAADNPVIKIETATTSLIFRVGDNGRSINPIWGNDFTTKPTSVICPKVQRVI